MNTLNTIFVISVAFLAVFVEAAFGPFRRFLGVQIDLLPGLIIYASLSSGLPTVALVAIFGGLWFDALSANPLGATILPLFSIGFIVERFRHLILRDQSYAQLVLGIGASAVAPLLTLLVLYSSGTEPVLGLGFLWQWVVMALVGGLVVPLYFRFFDKVYRTLGYEPAPELTFRQDREIARGRK